MRGFTLIELLVVLAIIALVAVAIPFAANRALPNRALDLALSQLREDLKAARRAAALSGAPVALTFAADGSSYRTARAERVLRAGMTLTSSSRLSTAYAGEAARLESLVWYPDGSNIGATFTLTLGERARRLRVSPLTGAMESDAP